MLKQRSQLRYKNSHNMITIINVQIYGSIRLKLRHVKNLLKVASLFYFILFKDHFNS